MRTEASAALVLAVSCIVSGFVAFTYFATSLEANPARQAFGCYASWLERHVSFIQMPVRGSQIAQAQLAACLFGLALSVVVGHAAFALFALAAALGPPVLLARRHAARVAELERQLDTWLLMLANALKATSSVGEAIASTVALVPRPFSEEVDLLVKELRLGTPLDRAIHSLARRINSTQISGAFATIVVARQTGGDLPRTLERAAAALRESARLEGVLRTKTAEGRGQVLVLASVPFLLCIMIGWLNPSWFDPMLEQQIGRAILGACGLIWTVATLWAHQISKADL